MFVTSLLNFIPRYKMFLGIEKYFKIKWWEQSSHRDGNKIIYNYLL